MTDQPERSKPVGQQPGSEMMAPGDEAPPGTPGTGEDVCPACGGSGHVDGQECDTCLGRGASSRSSALDLEFSPMQWAAPGQSARSAID